MKLKKLRSVLANVLLLANIGIKFIHILALGVGTKESTCSKVTHKCLSE